MKANTRENTLLIAGLLAYGVVYVRQIPPMLENPSGFSGIMEECLELFIPVFFIMALIQYTAFEKSNEKSDGKPDQKTGSTRDNTV